MLHGSSTSGKKNHIDQRSASTGDSVAPETTASVAAATENVSDEISRFNERNSGRRRTLWQVSDPKLRRGDRSERGRAWMLFDPWGDTPLPPHQAIPCA